MSFSQLDSQSEIIRDTQQEVSMQAESIGLSGEQLTAVTGIVNWKELLTAETPENAELMQAYTREMGYHLGDNRLLSNALKSVKHDAVTEAADALIQGIASGDQSLEQLVTADPLAIKAEFPSLSKSQARLLTVMTRQQQNLDALEISGLASQFPFPVTQQNYFGRFLASGCDEPKKAARHLQIANPFFIRMRSLLEGLSSDKRNHLIVDLAKDEAKGHMARFMEAEESESNELDEEEIEHHDRLVKNEIIHACVDSVSDFLGKDADTTINPDLRVLSVPRLPGLDLSQFDSKQMVEIAVAVYDWLLFGKKESELLTQKKLSIQDEKEQKQEKRALTRARKALQNHRKKEPSEEATRGQVKRWERREAALEREIQRLQENIKFRNMMRRQVKPVIKQLEAGEGVAARVEKFRETFLEAHREGKQVVLSFLPTFKNQWGGNSDFLKLLDRVATTKRFQSSEAVKFMRNAPLLLDSDASSAIDKGRVSGWGSTVEQKQRNLNVDPREISPSVRFVAAGVLPDKADPALALLVDTILIHVGLPGVADQRDLNHVVRAWSGRKSPKAADFLEYAFEHTSVLPKEDYYELLDALRTAGVEELPERCHALASERFRLPRQSLSDFELFNRRYKPQKLGAAPLIFDDLATFRGYSDLKLDAIGMAREVKQIESLLETEGMVCVVDGTAYHPELRTEVAATGDTIDAGDEADTDEIWGAYVRPSERAIRAFGLRMMEGDVGAKLKHHSLMSVHRPDKEEKVMASVIKAFFGVDIDITPDLAQVNKVLSDLVMHDDKMILVLDAENVNNLDQYRDFLELLDRYNIKVILRSREPLPGLPQVNVQPFQSHEIAERLLEEGGALARKLRLDTVPSKEILDFTADHVRRNRGSPGDDPLNLTLQVLDGAASLVRARGDNTLYEQDIVQAANGIFHKPDGQQMQLKVQAIDAFAERAPLEVLGQQRAIAEIASKMKSHILGLRDPSRPLTILLPGPTGVGKTELMLKFAQACDLPFFMIEGAEFSEENTINRLIGSPSGYVGPDEGILFQHLKENNVGLVFIDEIEKMHPSVYQALMNFFDKATLTSGKGEIVRRSGFTIVGASNAGADQLHRDMTPAEVRDVLAEAFVDRFGRPRPELVRRFDPITMLAIEEPHFKDILKANLDSIGKRPGFVNANLRLADVDDVAIRLLYDASKEVCAYNEKAMASGNKMGFGVIEPGTDTGLFYDMRHVSRALDSLVGEGLQRAAIEQYESGDFAKRGEPRVIKLVGVDEEGEKSIVVSDVA